MEEILAHVVRTASALWQKGWAERNAGNMSVRLAPGIATPGGGPDPTWRPIGATVPEVAGERFLFTGTGTFMRNVEVSPPRDLGVVEIDDGGGRFRVVWGYERGGLPTSELPPHLRAHAARARATGGGDRAVIHTHPPNLVALTYAMDLDTATLTRLLWEMHTECVVVFPMGCGFVPWRLPGSDDLARATAEVLALRTMAVWQHHGIVAAGPDLDVAFGLIETAEKAAEIYLKAAALGPIANRLTTEQLRALAARFGVEPDPEILAAAPPA